MQNRFKHPVRLCRWQQPVKRRRGDAHDERNRTARDAYRSLSCATRVLEAQDLSYSRIDTLSAGDSHDERGRSPTSGRTARPPRGLVDFQIRMAEIKLEAVGDFS